MAVFLDLVLLLFLFIALGWSADFVVKNVKYLGAVFKIRLFAFGILLGLVTSLPELFLGINATIDQAPEITVGNLLGGIIFKLGFVLGISLLFNQKINTNGSLRFIIPTVLAISAPIFLGLDGVYSFYDGLILILIYVGLIFYLYYLNQLNHPAHIEITDSNKVSRAIIFSIIGITGILISSHFIVDITLDLLNYVEISQFMIGLVVFSVGTNLPEISITFSSWRKKSSELSLSLLLSSSFTHILIFGVLAFFQPIIFEINRVYWLTSFFLGLVLILFGFFYYSGKKIDRREGIILIITYLVFMFLSIYVALTLI